MLRVRIPRATLVTGDVANILYMTISTRPPLPDRTCTMVRKHCASRADLGDACIVN